MSTLKEVAERADVSISTVSRVLNRPEKVKPTTRARVQEAIAALDYQPSRIAQRLRDRAGHSELIGMVIPDIQNPFYSQVVRGAEDVAYTRGAAIILCNSDETPEREHFYFDILRGESADGVLLPPSMRQTGALDVDLDDFSMPIVCFDRRIPGDPVDTVVVDNQRGAREMTQHLIENGHRRIGLICGPESLTTSTERAEGYREALHAADLPVDESLIFMDAPRQEAGYERARELLRGTSPPSALFAANNQLALGAFEYVRERGLSVPDELAIVAFDDAPWAKLLTPSLTTVRQPAYEMGRRAARLLFDRIDSPTDAPVLVTLPPTLVIRESCGASATRQ